MNSTRTIALILTAACAATMPAANAHEMSDAPSKDDTVSVSVTNAQGKDAGTVTFEQMQHGVVIRARLMNLTEGGHGFHLHETGKCSPDFKAAGGHYNPLGSGHGFDTENGYHVGDLPNIFAGADGIAQADLFVPQVTLRAKNGRTYPFTLDDADGSALIIHADTDDYVNMASAGAREACGVIFPAD